MFYIYQYLNPGKPARLMFTTYNCKVALYIVGKVVGLKLFVSNRRIRGKN